ncbi:hypothetical protein SprV_0200575600 [Sparganum proliferum]
MKSADDFRLETFVDIELSGEQHAERAREFIALSKLALPIMTTLIATNTMDIVSIVFCARLGTTQLAAAGLANSIFNIGGLAIMYGLLTACDTFFTQVR